jgi:hypothetical protein
VGSVAAKIFSGDDAIGYVGTVTHGGISFALTGVEASGSVANIGHIVTVALSGVSASGAVGTMLPSGWKWIDDIQSANWQAINNTQSTTWAIIDDSQSADWENVATS